MAQSSTATQLLANAANKCVGLLPPRKAPLAQFILGLLQPLCSFLRPLALGSLPPVTRPLVVG